MAIGAKKFYVKGVLYGAFEPDEDGREYHDLDQVDRDFAQMAAAGFNTVRIPHTMPPRALLDIAQRHGLMVMVGLSAEQYVGFLIDRSKKAPDVIGMVREKIRTVAGHPALLCYGIGNEIPAAVARWIGRKRIQRYLHAIYRAVKREDPEGLVTYVNYPTTEYLQLPFLDFVSFNIYLEDREKFRKYLARVQNIAGDRPLLMSEVGLDAMRNGEEKQADVLEWQIRIAFAAGCAGAVVFSWTDEWFRGGGAVDDWEFGLTRRSREPKSSLYAVSDAFAESPFKDYLLNPRFSVIVCTFNGSETIGETLEGLQKLDYPDFEIIVVDDGSADDTVQIVEGFDGVRLITIANGGLSGARNVDLRAATGEFVAYIDDDAWPDPHWLQYLAHAFLTSSHAGIGGPNLSPSDDSWKAQCVAKSPGGPLHVLTSDDTAEHIPGCNMAFRKADLVAIGGFDPTFVVAGDDVDVCWRLQEQGHTLGFHAGAMVWHRRRASFRRYLRQQAGYGRAEAMLETEWPAKYNSVGHISWQGKVVRARSDVYSRPSLARVSRPLGLSSVSGPRGITGISVLLGVRDAGVVDPRCRSRRACRSRGILGTHTLGGRPGIRRRARIGGSAECAQRSGCHHRWPEHSGSLRSRNARDHLRAASSAAPGAPLGTLPRRPHRLTPAGLDGVDSPVPQAVGGFHRDLDRSRTATTPSRSNAGVDSRLLAMRWAL